MPFVKLKGNRSKRIIELITGESSGANDGRAKQGRDNGRTGDANSA